VNFGPLTPKIKLLMFTYQNQNIFKIGFLFRLRRFFLR